MSTLLLQDFQAYVKNLCINNKNVLHDDTSNIAFVRLQSQDDLNRITSNASGMLVVISTFVGRAIGEADNDRIRQEATLSFLKRVGPNSGNTSDDVEAAQEFAMEVMFQFLARMKQD